MKWSCQDLASRRILCLCIFPCVAFLHSSKCVLLFFALAYLQSNQVMGWGEKAIELRSVETGNLEGVFMHKKAQKLKFLCERNDKVCTQNSGMVCWSRKRKWGMGEARLSVDLWRPCGWMIWPSAMLNYLCKMMLLSKHCWSMCISDKVGINP